MNYDEYAREYRYLKLKNISSLPDDEISQVKKTEFLQTYCPHQTGKYFNNDQSFGIMCDKCGFNIWCRFRRKVR